ncbi:DUF2057 family protein [Vibrio profundi]|uniref:DUF2057 family protein n=1 Tax=Vibrio profundi TaxID=1774960 RepID=UPI003735E524
MKLFKQSILAITMMTSFSAFSAVDVYFEQGIQALLVNGEEVSNLATQLENTQLNNGPNQVVVRISKLIREGGKYVKFNSEPMVVTFEAEDESITVRSGKQFDSISQVGDYDKRPKVKLLDSSGQSIDTHLGYLARGKGLIRDYEDELVAYNSDHKYSFNYADSATAKAEATAASPTKAKTVEFSLGDTDAVQNVKDAYSDLSESQRKAFLTWAVVQ